MGDGKVRCHVSVTLSRSAQPAGARVAATITVRVGDEVMDPSPQQVEGGGLIPSFLGSRGANSLQFNVKRQKGVQEDDGAPESEEASGDEPRGSYAEAERRKQIAAADVRKKGSVQLSYIVCEISGRWTCDNMWVEQNAHDVAEELEDPDRYADEPWAAALDDASHYGGGGMDGYSGFIFRTKPHVVSGEEVLYCGSQTIFHLNCELPEQIPPTLRGTAVRYSYALALVAAFDSEPAQALKVPIRVVLSSDPDAKDVLIPVPYRLKDPQKPSELTPGYQYTEPLTVTSSVVSSLPRHDIDLALALSPNGRLTPYRSDLEVGTAEDLESDQESLMLSLRKETLGGHLNMNGPFRMDLEGVEPFDEGITGENRLDEARKQRNALPVYMLKKGEKSIGRLLLPKTTHVLGDTLTAIFDMTEQELPCYRLSASLEVREVINPKVARGARDRFVRTDEMNRSLRKVYGEHTEFVSHTLNTYLVLSVPMDAPVSFKTEAVAVEWQLVFAFFTPPDGKVESNPSSWYLSDRDAEVLHWTLPLTVIGGSSLGVS